MINNAKVTCLWVSSCQLGLLEFPDSVLAVLRVMHLEAVTEACTGRRLVHQVRVMPTHL